jgi:NAD(P)-dependent dehydrogenase (short-subunit alcohol dehydrogenase family)
LNKTAIVTGGVRRLGRYISYYLADKGYNLAITYNSSSQHELDKTEKYLNQKNIRYKFYKCDIKDLDALKKTIDTIGNEFEKIDLLINNSGIIRKVNFEELTPEIFDEVMDVNLRSVLFTSQFALSYLQKSEEPSIIVIASLGGLQNWTNYFPYSLSKTAVIKLTKLLAKSLAPKIRVNAVAPGTIIIEGEEDGTPGKSPIEKIPLKKYGSPEDITSAIDFLINAKYVTGQIIPVDGGRTLN